MSNAVAPTLDYSKLDRADFDAVVTGELTHWALHMEEVVNSILIDYFISDALRETHFRRVVLQREGLTFQDKIEILQSLIPIWEPAASQANLKSILRRVEVFKGFRNAMAHGKDVSGHPDQPLLKIEMINRSGKPVVREITPQSHEKMTEAADALLNEFEKAERHLKSFFDAAKVKRA